MDFAFTCSVRRRARHSLGQEPGLRAAGGDVGVILLAVIEFVCPLRFEHLLSLVPQFVSMFLVFCILMNLLSIYAPLRIAAGTFKPSNPQVVPVLLQMAMMLFVFPLAEAPTLLPLGAEALCESLGWTTRAPICLALTLAQCALVVLLYRAALNWEGDLLSREQRDSRHADEPSAVSGRCRAWDSTARQAGSGAMSEDFEGVGQSSSRLTLSISRSMANGLRM